VVGYKQTDIGLIPEDWEVEKIGEVFDITAGGDIDKKNFNSYKTDKYQYPIYSNSLNEKGLYGYSNYYKSKPNCITITGRGSVGYAENRTNPFTAIIRLLVLQPKKNLSTYFVTAILNEKVDFKIESTGVPQLTAPQILNYQIPLPPLPEQEAIAEVLSDTDALIGALEKRIAKKRLIKQGAMQTLLTPKDDWEVKKLGEVANCFAGGTPSTFNPSYWGGDIIWLQSGKVQNKLIKNEEQLTKITKKGLNESSARLIKPNSVLVAITGATCGNIGLLTFEATANQSVVAIEPNKNFDYQFIYYSLLLNKNLILSYQTGSAQGGVNLKSVKNISLKFPIEFEQTRIATILSDMDNEINALEKKLSKTKELKQGLMQQLLTGKIRLV